MPCSVEHENVFKTLGPGFTVFKTGPEVIKLFFILNSAENEIYPAHKY